MTFAVPEVGHAGARGGPAQRQAVERLLFPGRFIDSRHSRLPMVIGPIRRRLLLSALGVFLAGCTTRDDTPLSTAERRAVADTLRSMIVSAYDLTKPGDAVARMLSLYPDTGRVVSASGGRVSMSRDSLEAGIRAFWQFVGQNMRNPKWTWDHMHVDVLSRDAAVLTATYRVPHRTPRGEPHTIGGALTVAFQRRDGRWGVVHEHLSDLAASPAADTAASGTAPPPTDHRH